LGKSAAVFSVRDNPKKAFFHFYAVGIGELSRIFGSVKMKLVIPEVIHWNS
jgi:hypothetical protein